MPRCFTVNFTLNNQSYMAVVSQLQSSVCVYIPDESLHQLVPNGRLTFDMKEVVASDTGSLDPVQQSLLEVLATIETKPE